MSGFGFGIGTGNFHWPGTFSKSRGPALLNIHIFPFRCNTSEYNCPYHRKTLWTVRARKKNVARGPKCSFPVTAISKVQDGTNTGIRRSARGDLSICPSHYGSESRTMATRIGPRRSSCAYELEPTPVLRLCSLHVPTAQSSPGNPPCTIRSALPR